MPRRHRRSPRPPTGDPSPVGMQRWEDHPDGTFVVRRVSGAGSTKTYRCPGCDQEVRPGTPHVVAWPADARAGVEDRRHWHTPCWAARSRRSRP